MSRRMGEVWSKAQAAAGAPLYALVSALIDPSACERQLCGVASF